MHNGEPPPFISWESVRSALDSLVYLSTARPLNPLERLLLVDEFLTNPDFPPGPHGRQFALDRILVMTTEEQYQRLRAALGMKLPDPDVTIETAMAEIAADERHGNLESIGWGLLYFRFVRAGLGLSLDMLAPAIHVDPRTLRRYQHHAIRKLTEQLIQNEWFARKRQRQRRLISELPSVPVRLFGREHMLREMQTVLGQEACHHVLITGATGVGKTAFVQTVLRHQIECEALDHLIWIHKPATAEFVRRQLIERLLAEDSTIHLREYLLLRRVGVVLDSIEPLQADRQALELLLDDLNSALVFLTSRIAFPLRNITRHVVLSELDEAHAVAFIGSVSGQRLDEATALDVYRTLGGNPLALKLAVQSQTLTIDTDELYAQVYDELNARLKRAWYIFALAGPNPIDALKIAAIWSISQRDVSRLARYFLIEATSNGLYVIPPSARSFVEQLYSSNAGVEQVIQELLNEINTASLPLALNIIEQILLSCLPPLDVERQRAWIRACWREGVRQSHYARWCSILERFLQEAGTGDQQLMVAYGICLRLLSRWADAENVFQKSARLAGEAGQFLEQARVLLELGTVYRCQGRYEQAAHVFALVHDILTRHPDDALTDSLKLEVAVVAIDSGNAVSALQALAGVGYITLRLQMLRSEAYLLVGDWEQCTVLAYQALEMPTCSSASEARIQSILGRCYAQQKNAVAARRHLELAVTLLEQDDDPFALARAQSNLGAMLIELHDYDEAESLLERAQHVQTRLGDRLGVSASEHNLRLLRIAQLDSRS